MTCRKMQPLLDALLDGELDDARASAVRGHLRICVDCARGFEARRALLEAARALEPIDPPPTLWAAIEARVAQEEIADAGRPGWWWWWHAWKRRLAYGGLFFAAVTAVALVALRREGAEEGSTAMKEVDSSSAGPASSDEAFDRPRSAAHRKAAPSLPTPSDPYLAALAEVEQADAEYRQAIEELKSVVAQEKARWRPEVARSFDENLAAIDAAVARQRRAVSSSPGDLEAREALFAGYRKEIDFLQEAVMRGEVSP